MTMSLMPQASLQTDTLSRIFREIYPSLHQR